LFQNQLINFKKITAKKIKYYHIFNSSLKRCKVNVSLVGNPTLYDIGPEYLTLRHVSFYLQRQINVIRYNAKPWPDIKNRK